MIECRKWHFANIWFWNFVLRNWNILCSEDLVETIHFFKKLTLILLLVQFKIKNMYCFKCHETYLSCWTNSWLGIFPQFSLYNCQAQNSIDTLLLFCFVLLCFVFCFSSFIFLSLPCLISWNMGEIKSLIKRKWRSWNLWLPLCS